MSPRLDVANGDAVREAVIAGLGVAVLSKFIVHDGVRRGELSIVLPKHAIPSLPMIALHPSMRNQTARAFIDFLVNEFAGEPFWNRELFNRPTAYKPL